VTLRRLDLPRLLAGCEPFGAALGEVFARLVSPATKSDLVRLALLYGEGGVYLDIDTVTLVDFGPLCRGVDAFCGLERIVYPASVRHSHNPLVRMPAFLRSTLRSLLRLWPTGFRPFRKVEGWYPKMPNGAILAARSRGCFITECISEAVKLPAERQPVPCALGPHLLQAVVPRFHLPDLAVHEPEVFFPLGPEISEHWFRLGREPHLEQVLSPKTVLVHWYGSVRTKHVVPVIDPAYVRAHAHEQLFSALALPLLRSRTFD
jgi:Glycosyltransferase sugar-binding region containing DXD motif